MDDSQKVIDWSLRNRNKLGLKVEYYEGLRTYFPKIFDIGVFIDVSGKKSFGRGTDFNERVAYCKAFSEAIERSFLEIYNIKNSNGLAAHYKIENACQNAKQELIERDAFLCAFLIGKGFQKIRSLKKLERIVDGFANVGIEVQFYRLCTYDIGSCILVSANGRYHSTPFGFILGSAFEVNEEQASYKAFIEVIRNLDHLVRSKDNDSINLENFMNLKNHSFSDHGKLAKNLEYALKLESLFAQSQSGFIIKVPPKNTFEYRLLDSSAFPIDGLPLNVFQCASISVQNLYEGPTLSSSLNMNRLIEILGKPLVEGNLTTFPHPFD